jgi:hypothetical protein
MIEVKTCSPEYSDWNMSMSKDSKHKSEWQGAVLHTVALRQKSSEIMTNITGHKA